MCRFHESEESELPADGPISDRLAVGAAAAMLAMVEILPLQANAVVAFEFDVGFGFPEALFVEYRDEIGEEEGVDTAAEIFFAHGNEQEVDYVVFAMYGLKEMIPSEGEQLAMGFAERF